MDFRSTAVRVADSINPLLSSPAGPLEGVAMAASFEPSLMPRSSTQQGIMMGLAGLTARGLGAVVEKGTQPVTPGTAKTSTRVAIRGGVGPACVGLALIPARPGESLEWSGTRSAGQVAGAVAASVAAYDISHAGASRMRSDGVLQPVLTSAAVSAGLVVFAAKNLKERKRVEAAKPEDAPASLQYRGTDFKDAETGRIISEAGVPLLASRTSGAQWFKAATGAQAGPEDVQ